MPKAVAYIRTSTDRQELSIEAQGHKVKAMAAIKDVALSEVIVDDGHSAKDMDRPGMQKLMELVRSKSVDMVIIAKLDRLTRSLRDLADIVDLFTRKKVALVSVAETLDTSTATGRMIVNLIGLIAQWERETIAERTSDALQAKRRRGERAGNIPYGYELGEGKQLKLNSSEQTAVRRIKTLHDAGLSLRSIADSLNAKDIRTRSGTPWRFQYVARVLASAAGGQ